MLIDMVLLDQLGETRDVMGRPIVLSRQQVVGFALLDG